MSFHRRDRERDARIDELVLRAIHVTNLGVPSAWRNYVAGHTKFPFHAKYLGFGGLQPFCGSARVLVIGLANDDECVNGLQAKVMDGQRSVRAPLELLLPADDTDQTQAVLDWHYWVRRGKKL